MTESEPQFLSTGETQVHTETTKDAINDFLYNFLCNLQEINNTGCLNTHNINTEDLIGQAIPLIAALQGMDKGDFYKINFYLSREQQETQDESRKDFIHEFKGETMTIGKAILEMDYLKESIFTNNR